MKWRQVRLVLYSALGLAVLFGTALVVLDWRLTARTERTRIVVERIKGAFSDQCKVGMTGQQSEETLSRLGLSHTYVPKAKFYYGNLLEALSVVPPDEAKEYLIGTSGLLGTYGFVEIYLTAIFFVDEDKRALSCFITTRGIGL